ncbi:hypothetical protein EJV46_07535 [Roseococcus sp. SYP-B2431]|uniref:hypothetical protein n=1 Tax=Roseococcus sp. SYP-B2431 TaxID=2496640 RepID=UPI00103BD056|nr:hypothetical protein [Roseococcus sp. SYP-B2431]TCI00474.1 hypothetical protein EJV46_07535 [Roseococcus sp. SYP-B2431]
MTEPRTRIVFGAEGIEILLREESGAIRAIPLDVAAAPWAPEALGDPAVTAALDEWAFSNVMPGAIDWHYLQAILIRCEVDVDRLAAEHPPRG